MTGGAGGDRSYNNIYERLVNDQHDIVGAVAYALYKRDKREYIRKHNLSAGDRGVMEYHGHVGDEQLRSFRLSAQQILSLYTARDAAVAYEKAYKTASEDLGKANKDLAAEVTKATQTVDGLPNRLVRAKDEILKRLDERTRFWSSVGASALGSVVLGLLMLIFIALDRTGMNPLSPILPKPSESKAVEAKPSDTAGK